jgi:hypothetical protein
MKASGMLPPHWCTPWVAGALYGEVYIGLCRALALPWLNPWALAFAARPAAASRDQRSTAPAAAASEAVAAPAAPRPPTTSGSIISFEHARARLAARL